MHHDKIKKIIEGHRIFLSGPSGTGKSHTLKMIQKDMRYFVHNVSNCDPDQPTVFNDCTNWICCLPNQRVYSRFSVFTLQQR